MRVLTLCPTRNRPERLRRMLNSFYHTKTEHTDIAFYIADDDPRLLDYGTMNLPKVYRGPRLDINHAFNHMAISNLDYDYFSITNDDYYYHTPEWDKALVEAVEKRCNFWGIADSNSVTFHGNYHEHRHPSGCVISANIVKALGYIYHPSLNSYRNDTALRDIAEGIGPRPDSHFVYLPEVKIEHEHFSNGKAPHDPTYALQYDPGHMDRGNRLYEEWRQKYLRPDLAKLRDAMLKEAYFRGFTACYYKPNENGNNNPYTPGEQNEAWKSGYNQCRMEAPG